MSDAASVDAEDVAEAVAPEGTARTTGGGDAPSPEPMGWLSADRNAGVIDPGVGSAAYDAPVDEDDGITSGATP